MGVIRIQEKRSRHAEEEPVISPYVARQLFVTLQSVRENQEEALAGTIGLSITSPSLSSGFEKGKEYYVDFIQLA